MTVEELMLYANTLEREIVGLQEEIRILRKPNMFYIGLEREFRTEQEMMDWLPEHSVKQLDRFRRLDTCFAVKTNQDRVDYFQQKAHAEASAMLHRPG